MILYGSRARGDAVPDSDLDIAVILTGRDQQTADGRRPAPFSDPVWQAIVNAAFGVEKVLGGLSAAQLAQVTDLRQRLETGALSAEAWNTWIQVFCGRAATNVALPRRKRAVTL